MNGRSAAIPNLVVDNRQEKKVLHKMSDIIALVFFALLSNADDWVEIETFGEEHEEFLRTYLELPNGIPSHDTIQRVFAMVSSEFLSGLQTLWNEMLNSGEGEKIRKILAIDRKTQRGNGNVNQKANHIVSAGDEDGFCLGEKRVKARGGIEKREYWQSEDIAWMPQKKEWAGLKSIAMTRNTIIKNGIETTETRYFISSLPLDVNMVARVIRGHWMVERYHWHLDVTFREDENHTLEKQAAFNLNIMRKLALHVLKIYEVGRKPRSLRKKRFAICTNPAKHISAILTL